VDSKIIFIGNIIPEPGSSAAGKRIMQLMMLFIEFGYDVQYWSETIPSKYSFECKSLSIELKIIKSNDRSIDSLLIEEKPRFIIFDRFMTEEKFGWRIANLLPDTIRILDSEDLHFLRDFRQKNCSNNPMNYSEIVFSDIFQREISSMYRCDLTLTISEFEMEFLVNSIGFPNELLHYIPIYSDLTQLIPKVFENRQDFCFIGNFHHKPNIDCVTYLKHEIWPSINKKLPNSKMHIYGAYTNQNIYNLQDKKLGFLVRGRADTVSEVYSNHRVLLAPIRFGAGLKGKLLDAMEYGLPSVTTSVGVEGISQENHWNGIVVNNPNEFANAAIKLYTDKFFWIQSQITGYKILNSRFKKSIFDDQLRLRLEELSFNILEIRKRNYIGVILFRNQNLATKYMSKWIEEKNKKS
jgi:glycosyltransferase involved in cell wall biosynthesis